MVGPEDAEMKTSERVPSSHLGGTERHAEPAGRRPHRPLVDPLPRLQRIDHRTDGQRSQHGGEAPDMIAVGMRDDDRRERVQPHASQLALDMCLGWTAVDQHRPLGRLEQDAVALPDVEERDAETRGRRPRRRRMERPPAEPRERHERNRCDDGRAATVGRHQSQADDARGEPRARDHHQAG